MVDILLSYVFSTNPLPTGESVDVDGITFTNGGVSKKYESIDELLEDNEIDILYPTELPNGLKIESIIASDKLLYPIQVIFTNNFGVYSIHISNGKTDFESLGIYEKVESNGFTYYVIETNGQFTAIMYENGYKYQFSSNSKENLLEIINNISEN